MSIVASNGFPLKQFPISGASCNWFAAHNALIVDLQRKDIVITKLTSRFGKIAFQTSFAASFNAEFNALRGNRAYVSIGGYSKVVNVVSVEALSFPLPSKCLIVTDEDWTADINSTGFVNYVDQRKNYFVELGIYRFYGDIAGIVDPPTNALVARRKDFPSPEGLMSVDLMASIRRIVNWNDEFQYDFVNLRDENLSAPLGLQYRESWDGNRDGAWSGFVDNLKFNIANSAMQIKNNGGSNLINFFSESSGRDRGKFLSNFVKPTYWKDYPFDLQFIYPKEFAGSALVDGDGLPLLKRFEQPKRGNTAIGLNDKLLDWEGIGFVNRMLLKGNYDSNYPSADNVDVWLGYDGAGDVDRYVDEDFVDEGYIDGESSSSAQLLQFIEKINIKLGKCFRKSPVYLKWLGYNGSWNYWLFQANQTRNIKTASLGEISQFVADLEVADTVTDYLGKSAEPALIMGVDNIDSNDIDGLETLYVSPKVMMLYNPATWQTEGPKWVTVQLSTANKLLKQTKATRHRFEIEAMLPELNLQTA